MPPGGWATPWAGGIPDVGETFVQGQDQATARDLLDAAEQLGLHPGSVRAVRGGFIVPNDVWDHMQENRADQAGF